MFTRVSFGAIFKRQLPHVFEAFSDDRRHDSAAVLQQLLRSAENRTVQALYEATVVYCDCALCLAVGQIK